MSRYYKKKDEDSFRRLMFEGLAELISKINTNTYTESLTKLHERVLQTTGGGTYVILNESGVAEGAMYCSNTRDVISYGLGARHADLISSVVVFDAIVWRWIKPLQTLKGSMPAELRDALGFIGPEKDEHTRTMRWILQEK